MLPKDLPFPSISLGPLTFALGSEASPAPLHSISPESRCGGQAIDQKDYYQKLGCLSGFWLVQWDTPPVSNGAWLYYSIPHTCPCHPGKSILASLSLPPNPPPQPLWKGGGRLLLSGGKICPLLKSLAWWVAPFCFSEEFGLGSRHQHHLSWVLWVSSKWNGQDTHLHLESRPIQGLLAAQDDFSTNYISLILCLHQMQNTLFTRKKPMARHFEPFIVQPALIFQLDVIMLIETFAEIKALAWPKSPSYVICLVTN